MSSSISSLARRAVVSFVALAALPIAAIAAPAGLRVPAAVADSSAVRLVLDDKGWRRRLHSCCNGRRSDDGARTLDRGVAPRLGYRDRSSNYGSHDWRGAYGGDEPIYRQQRLAPPRVYQRNSLGGGFYGDSRPLDDGF